MHAISYVGPRFPPRIIGHAVWLYLRFTLSYRDVEDLLAARGLDVSYETVRRWVLKFGPAVARSLRHARPKPDGRWHLDEMVVLVNGRQMYLWRAVDSEGEVLDMLVQPRRDKAAAMKLLRKLLKRSAVPAQNSGTPSKCSVFCTMAIPSSACSHFCPLSVLFSHSGSPT